MNGRFVTNRCTQDCLVTKRPLKGSSLRTKVGAQ